MRRQDDVAQAVNEFCNGWMFPRRRRVGFMVEARWHAPGGFMDVKPLIMEGFAMLHAKKSFILTIPFVVLSLLLASPSVYAKDKGSYPDAPPRLKDAEAKGLHRLTIDELKTFFPGTMDLKRHRGGLVTKIFKPDGTVQALSFRDLDGTWRLDEKRDAYCDRISQKVKRGERCYAVFAAGDGVHYFDYDISDGLQTVVWRRGEEK
jgi:hypothetical protein